MQQDATDIKTHKVAPGDCIYSIAAESGLPWRAVWDDPANEPLRQVRTRPELLQPGDRVAVRARKTKDDPGATEQRHRFRVAGRPVVLQVRFLDEGRPRGPLPYVLEVEGRLIEGQTDEGGCLRHEIPPTVRRVRLRLGDRDAGEDYVFRIGCLDPPEEVSGVQGRLHNLGYETGQIDNVLGPVTRAALEEFQRDHDLEVTGQPDEATRSKLVELHGS